MTANEAIEKIKEVLTGKVKDSKFEATDELIDGTMIYTENEFEVGEVLNVIKEDGTMEPAPDGDHETVSGKIVTVGPTEEDGTPGIITEIKDKESDEAPEVETEDETESEDVVTEEEEDFSKFSEVMVEVLKPFTKTIKDLNAKVSKLESKLEKFSNESGDEPIFSKKELRKNDTFSTRMAKIKQLKK